MLYFEKKTINRFNLIINHANQKNNWFFFLLFCLFYICRLIDAIVIKKKNSDEQRFFFFFYKDDFSLNLTIGSWIVRLCTIKTKIAG